MSEKTSQPENWALQTLEVGKMKISSKGDWEGTANKVGEEPEIVSVLYIFFL